jgi:hypothetical protein
MVRTTFLKSTAGVAALAGLASACNTSTAANAAGETKVRVDGRQVVVPLANGEARVDVGALGVTARTKDGRATVLSDPATGLGTPGKVSEKDGTASWSYPQRGLTVTARAERGRLLMDVRSSKNGDLTWPITGTDKATSRLAVPTAEGLGIPVNDPFWNSGKGRLAGEDIAMAGGLTMPFWGYNLGSYGVNYIVPTDIGTNLKFISRGGRLHGQTTHTFAKGNDTQAYTVAFSLTDASPVASAADYRRWMSERHELGSLRQKIKRNPEVGKLAGAFHAYLWGDALTAKGVQEMKRLGLNRMWLGYDANGNPMKADAVDAAKKAGYLVGPYDSFANAQDPKTADNPSSKWPDHVYPDGCVIDYTGKPKPGFGGRGCYLSSEYLARQEPKHHYMADRTKAFTGNGANSYFLDVDAAGELWRDFSKTHPMTAAKDRANRTARMKRLSDRFVLGSEKASAWANKDIAFDHGSLTESPDYLWPLQKNKEFWGAYYPDTAPKFFFKPVAPPADAAKGMYDPAYRLPLYETVLHDSVVNLDRWELSYYKLTNVQKTRALLGMLYNTPLNFTLDGPTLKQHGAEIAKLQHFFEPLHKAAATQPMTGFQWLTPDRLVQRTTFGGNALTVTANFGKKPYQGLPGGCVQANLPGQPPQRLCP